MGVVTREAVALAQVQSLTQVVYSDGKYKLHKLGELPWQVGLDVGDERVALAGRAGPVWGGPSGDGGSASEFGVDVF